MDRGDGMTDAVIVAVITGACSLIGAFLTGQMTARKSAHTMEINQAVTNERIDELTREVRAHNNFAQRMPVVETEIEEIKRRIGEYHTH